MGIAANAEITKLRKLGELTQKDDELVNARRDIEKEDNVIKSDSSIDITKSGILAGIKAYQDKNYPTAFHLLNTYKDDPVFDAIPAYCLAQMYSIGRGTEKKPIEAVKWYLKGANQGFAYSQMCLGALYFTGDGIQQNYTEAIHRFRQAVDQENKADRLTLEGEDDIFYFAITKFYLGTIYTEGSGVEKDYIEAVKWYQKSADQGFFHSEVSLGAMYYNGKGVEQDYTEAIRRFCNGITLAYEANHLSFSSLIEKASLERVGEF